MTYNPKLYVFSEYYITEENIGGFIMEYSEFWVDSRDCRSSSCGKSNSFKKEFCPQLPGTVLRVSIPPGATINLLNLVELTSPGGICLILRLPILSRGAD